MTFSHIALGNQALQAGDYPRALEHYRLAQRIYPHWAHLLECNIKIAKLRLTHPESFSTSRTATVDIVIPVFNALEDVKRCLASLEMNADDVNVHLIIVNDGSDAVTTQWLRARCTDTSRFTLIEHPGNLGYTKAVNTGLRASVAPYVITQNSDTIVSRGWLRGMLRCIESSPSIGIVGPLSNAATWQNVPILRDETGSFAVNTLPPGVDVDRMARLVAGISARAYPRLPFINGFCFMLRRAVIEAIGYMDEITFPIGYGEEIDYCIRAADAGFELAVADDVFVFHAKSRSFGQERRKALSVQGFQALKQKHSREKYFERAKIADDSNELRAIREQIKAALDQFAPPR